MKKIILTTEQYFSVPSMWHPHPQGEPCHDNCYWPEGHWLTKEVEEQS